MSHDPRDAEAARRRVLDPYLNRLREWNHRVPGMNGNRPAIVQIGKRQLRVESRERAVIEHWAPERVAPNADSRLVMDSLSLMIKLLTELEQITRHPSTASRQSAEIMVSIALGEAIHKQLLALSGKHGETLWAGLNTRMEHAIQQARNCLEGVDEARVAALCKAFEVHLPPKKAARPVSHPELPHPAGASTLADQLGPEQAAVASMLAGDDDDDEDLELPAELQATVDPPSRLSSRTRAAMLLCLVSLMLWGLVAIVPDVLREPPAKIDLSTMERLPWIDRVVSRPASLYVEVDDAAWEAMPHGERWLAMKQLVQRCATTGARGMLVRDGHDRPLAQWIEGRGVVLHAGKDLEAQQVTDSKGERQERAEPPAQDREYPEIPARDAVVWN